MVEVPHDDNASAADRDTRDARRNLMILMPEELIPPPFFARRFSGAACGGAFISCLRFRRVYLGGV